MLLVQAEGVRVIRGHSHTILLPSPWEGNAALRESATVTYGALETVQYLHNCRICIICSRKTHGITFNITHLEEMNIELSPPGRRLLN